MYGDQFRRICMWILGLKGLKRFDCIERLTVEDPIDYTLIFFGNKDSIENTNQRRIKDQ